MFPMNVMLESGSKISAIEASLNDGLAVVFEYENRILEFSLTAKIKLDDGKRSNVSVIFSSLNSLLPDASWPV